MKVDLTPSEVKRLIKDYETEQLKLSKEYSELEEKCLSYQAYTKLDRHYKRLMYNISSRMLMIGSRLKYLKTLYEDRANCMRALNDVYGVNSDKKEKGHED